MNTKNTKYNKSTKSGRALVQNENDFLKKRNALTVARGRALDKMHEKDRKWDNETGLQRVRHGVDRPLLIVLLVIICLGAATVFSASYPTAGIGEIKKHLMFLGIGAFFIAICLFLNYSVFRPLSVIAALISIALLILVLIIGVERGGAKRWILISGSVTIQPSEIAKLALVLILAWYLDRHADDINSFVTKKKFVHGIVIPGVIMMVFCGLVLCEKHLSGTAILAFIGLCIIYLAGADFWKMVAFFAPFGAVAVTVYLIRNSYALGRITTFLDEDADKSAEAWQTTQGLYAIGNGGLLGTGIGNSNLKHAYVSEAQNDFIFSIWCEEMGFVGAVLLIALYGVLIWRGIKIARHAPDTFSSLTAFGITCKTAIQVLLNMVVVTDMLFNTGVSLPFFSSGGSAIVVQMIEMGILLSISKHSYQKKI